MNENKYEEAIAKGETVNFLLGRGSYLYPDYDWGGTHTPSLTFIDIMKFAEKYGNERMLKQLEEDLQSALQNPLNPSDFLNIVTYVHIYGVKFYEGKLMVVWYPDPQLKKIFKEQLTALEKDNSTDAFMLSEIQKSIQIIKDRFDIDILE